MGAARSAASEVNDYLDRRAVTHQTLNVGFTQAEIDTAIGPMRRRTRGLVVARAIEASAVETGGLLILRCERERETVRR